LGKRENFEDFLERNVEKILKEGFPTYNTLPPDMQELLHMIYHDITLLIIDLYQTKNEVIRLRKHIMRLSRR